MDIIAPKHHSIISQEINLPLSKSINNRLLILHLLSQNKINPTDLSQSDDTQILFRLLEQIKSSNTDDNAVELFTDNAGTVFRFLTALLSTQKGNWILNGSERMHQRPISTEVEALRQWGAEIEYLQEEGFPPLSIKGKELQASDLHFQKLESSQFVSALLLISPLLGKEFKMVFHEKIPSLSYIDMTIKLLKKYGIDIERKKNTISFLGGRLQKIPFDIETDWSSAAFWYELCAISGQMEITLKGLKKDSIQGDSRLPEIFQNLGVETIFNDHSITLRPSSICVTEFNYDFSPCPDLAQAVITTCAAKQIRGVFSGLESLKIKETDRIFAMQTELAKIGAKLEENSNTEYHLTISKQKISGNLTFETYKDHRMAMCLAPLAIKFGKIILDDGNCVEKSYPNFWEEFKKIGFSIDY